MATLKELRNLCRVTRKSLSEMTGINPRIIQRYEDGDSKVENMTVATAKRLSEAIGCDIVDLGDINLDRLDQKAIKELAKSGEITMPEVIGMAKVEAVRRGSCIGQYLTMFYRNFDQIPIELFGKLTVEELSRLVDAIHEAYSEGKRDGRREVEREI